MLLAINKIPDDVILESLFFGQLEKADTLKSMLELYRLDVTQNGKPKSYERLLDMLQKHILERQGKILNFQLFCDFVNYVLHR